MIQVGEWAIVIGNRGAEYDRSVTVGVVSGFNRAIEGNSRDRYGRRSVVTNQMIRWTRPSPAAIRAAVCSTSWGNCRASPP